MPDVSPSRLQLAARAGGSLPHWLGRGGQTRTRNPPFPFPVTRIPRADLAGKRGGDHPFPDSAGFGSSGLKQGIPPFPILPGTRSGVPIGRRSGNRGLLVPVSVHAAATVTAARWTLRPASATPPPSPGPGERRWSGPAEPQPDVTTPARPLRFSGLEGIRLSDFIYPERIRLLILVES